MKDEYSSRTAMSFKTDSLQNMCENDSRVLSVDTLRLLIGLFFIEIDSVYIKNFIFDLIKPSFYYWKGTNKL